MTPAGPGPLRGAKLFTALRALPARRGSLLTVRLREAPQGERGGIGMAVGTPVGNAVIRNRLKRRLRALWRALAREQPEYAGRQIFIQVRPPAGTAPFTALDDELRRLLARVPAPGRRA